MQRATLLRRAGTYSLNGAWAPAQQRITACCAASGARENKTAGEAPAGYVRQLALYRAVLTRLYPQKAIRAALLWTETPELMEISAPALDAALASYHLGVSALDPARSRS